MPLGRIILILVVFAGLGAAESMEQAFDHLYSFRFESAHESLDQLREQRSEDPMFHTARASVYLFSEMARLGILESEFFGDRGEKLKKLEIEASPAVRESLYASLAEARDLAATRLESNPQDADAHFALSLASGIECNYAIFVEKRRRRALPLAKDSYRNAMRTLALDPDYRDARLVTGINEYVMGSVPFFVRWFLNFEGIEGSKERGVASLEEVARTGRYLDTMAKIVLATIHIREKRWQEAWRITNRLAQQYPANPVFRKELAKLRQKVAAVEAAG